jgi:hypothetical protein
VVDKQHTLGDNNIIVTDFAEPFKICQQIDQIPQDKPVKLFLSIGNGCPLGNTSGSEVILKKLKNRSAGYIVYIQDRSSSSGTILALGANEIHMKYDSCLGKFDPQINVGNMSYPAILYHDLPSHCVTDKTIANVRLSQYLLLHLEEVIDLIFDRKSPIVKETVRQQMVYSQRIHDQLFDRESCQKMGLPVIFDEKW